MLLSEMEEAESTEKEESCLLMPVTKSQVHGKWGKVTRKHRKSRQAECACTTMASGT